MSKKLITVFGATGAQGGSVVRFLLDDPDKTFAVRAVTRNPQSEKAKELLAQGAEVVKGDLDDVESLKKAVEGSYGVFGVTNYWEGMSAETEVRQGKAIVDAVKAAGVQHYIWSTLDRTSDPVVEHSNSKADVNDYLLGTGVPRTSLYTVFYFENHLNLPPFKLAKGSTPGTALADWPILLSDGPIGGYSVTDTGGYALAAFKDPKTWLGKDMRVLPVVYTPREYVKVVKEVTGREIELVETSRERFNGMKSAMEELWNNMEMFYKTKGKLYGYDTAFAQQAYPEQKDLRRWVEANKEALIQTFS